MTEPLRNYGDHGGATAVCVVQAPQWHRAFGVTGALGLYRLRLTFEVMVNTSLGSNCNPNPKITLSMSKLSDTVKGHCCDVFDVENLFSRSRKFVHDPLYYIS